MRFQFERMQQIDFILNVIYVSLLNKYAVIGIFCKIKFGKMRKFNYIY